MQFTFYLEKLLGNRTKIAMLRAFARLPDKAWTSRELARYLHTYNTTIMDNLGDLMDMGVVDTSRHGKGNVITVNRDNFVFSRIVVPLYDAEQKTFDALTADIKKSLPKEASVAVLFGSVAAHKETPHSDIDLLVVATDKRRAEMKLEEVQGKFARKYGNELSYRILTPAEFRQKQHAPFISGAKKIGMVIHGRWP